MKGDRSTPTRISPTEGELVVHVESRDVGVVRERLDAAVTGSHIGVAFNPGFFQDCLAALALDNVTLQVVSALRPVVMAESDLTVLLMPSPT